MLGAAAAHAGPTAVAPTTLADRLHARALESFRAGRFPEAYGRFMGLANAGHPASARYALWMCENGLALFGKDWDCAPHEVEDWALAAGVAMPRIVAARGVPSGAAKVPFSPSVGRSPGAERPQRGH
jgi:hypothetical protein